MSDDVEKALKAAMRGLSVADRAVCNRWVESFVMDKGLMENILSGMMRFGPVKDGEVTFQLTDAGDAYARTHLVPQARGQTVTDG